MNADGQFFKMPEMNRIIEMNHVGIGVGQRILAIVAGFKNKLIALISFHFDVSHFC